MISFAIAVAIAALSPVAPLPTPSTAERTDFVQTGRYAEAVSQCENLARIYASRARCITFGTTPEGRFMRALVLSDDGVLDAEAATKAERPVIVMQGGIHAGEIDGKDAGFLVAKQLLNNTLVPGVLSAVTLVFVPVFNVDGHERMSKNNRPNQRGPAEMGWRTTAQNLNLNRDYMKAQAPEMHAMLRLLNAWDPVLYIDLHVTDGAQFQHDVAVIVDPALAGPAALQPLARALQSEVLTRLKTPAGGAHLPLDFYPSFEVDDDPASGFAVGVAPPRFSHPYWALHNRIGMLVETHSWRDYKHRVNTTSDVIIAVLMQAQAHAKQWRQVERALDADITARLGDVVLSYKNTDAKTTVDFLGYRYTRTLSAISGGLRTRYDESRPEVWKLPFVAGVTADVTVTPPRAGYVVPAAHAAWIKEKLALHGVQFEVFAGPKRVVGAAFKATAVKPADKSYEGAQQMTLAGAWAPATKEFESGGLFVPIHQKNARVAVQLFEPLGADALVRWGMFNAAFEQKEYMESYVAEDAAEQMMKDPKVAAAFYAKLKAEPAFAASPQARLQFFFERHPSFDDRLNVYPVMRVDAW